MKKAISYNSPRDWTDEDSRNGDGMMRAIEFTMLCIGTADAVEDAVKFADRMYDTIREWDEARLVSMVTDMGALQESCKKISTACMQVALAKATGIKLPTAQEMRDREGRT